MSAREVVAARERRAADEAAQRLLDAPRRGAVRQQAEDRRAADIAEQVRAEKQRAYWAQWVSEEPDPRFVITPALRTASMSKTEAAAHNLAEVDKFTKDVPEYAAFKTPENAEAIVSYFRRNGVTIYDAAMLRTAFIRLRDLGLLAETPIAAEQPSIEPSPLSAETKVEASVAPKFYLGRDYATGMEREFTSREVERMSSDEYRRAFAVVPTVSELFSQMREANQ